MTSFSVQLTSVHDVKEFVEATSRCTCDVDVLADRYVVDGKSVMGLFSINLCCPLTVQVRGTDEQGEALRRDVARFLSK